MSMKQVHHGETLLAIVGGRQIDGHTTLLTQCRTVVPHTGKRSMRHIVDLIEMPLVVAGLRHDENITQRRDVAVHITVGRVNETLAIYVETVRIEFGVERLGRHCPHAVLLLAHRKILSAYLIEVSSHAHLLGCGIVEVERHSPVAVHHGRFHSRTLA